MEKPDPSLRSLLFEDDAGLGQSLSCVSPSEDQQKSPELVAYGSPHASGVDNKLCVNSPPQRASNTQSCTLTRTSASPSNPDFMFSPHTPLGSQNFLGSPPEHHSPVAYTVDAQVGNFHGIRSSPTMAPPAILGETNTSAISAYQTPLSTPLVGSQPQSFSKVLDSSCAYSPRVHCSDSHFGLSDSNRAVHDNFITSLPCTTGSLYRPSHPKAAPSLGHGLGKTDTLLCKPNTGLPISSHGPTAATAPLNPLSLPSSCQSSGHLTSTDLNASPGSGNNSYRAGCHYSNFTPSSASNSSSDESSTHFLGDPGGGQSEPAKPSYPESTMGQQRPDVINNQATHVSVGSFLEETSNKSDSGYGDMSSNSSQDSQSQHSPPTSFSGYTPWTDKLIVEEYQPLPLPASDALPLPMGHISIHSMLGLSAGHLSPQTDKQQQVFSALRSGFEPKVGHQKISRPSSTPTPQKSCLKPLPNKERRFKRTADALHKSGLWEVAMKTGNLIKRNRELQKELDHFKVEALNFLKSVIKNPQNRDFIKNVLNNALLSNPTPKNRSVMTAVVSAAVKLETDVVPTSDLDCKVSVAQPLTVEASSAAESPFMKPDPSQVPMELE